MKIINKARAVYRHLTGKKNEPLPGVERFDVVCLSGCGWGAFGLEVTRQQAHNRGVLHAGTAHRGNREYSVSRSR